MTKEAAKTEEDPREKEKIEKEKEREKTRAKTKAKAKTMTEANDQHGANPQVDNQIANLVLTL